ncbi:hypothetical protein JL720_15751 [Aureococcus anophagefferens]|nr:hypothetical protein JL720_15751 [Aureococcus anophagefferens]
MPTARPALFLLAALRAATPFHARPVAVRRPTARRSEPEPYEAYDPYEENLWLDDGDEEALTFGNEQLTLSGEGNAFGDSTVADVADDYRFPISYVADAILGFGIPPPIRDDARIADILDADQAFALLEAVTSLDAAEVEAPTPPTSPGRRPARGAAGRGLRRVRRRGLQAPHGVETQLRREQYEALRSRFGHAYAGPPTRSTGRLQAPRRDRGPWTPRRGRCRYVQDADRPTYQDGA